MAIPFWHKLVFLMLIWLLIIGLSRAFFGKSVPLQQKCHSTFGCLTPFLQWYTWLFFGFVGLFMECMGNIIKSDYIDTDWLEKGEEHGTGAEPIPAWLKKLSLTAPMVATVAFLILMCHVAYIIRCCIADNQADNRLTPGGECERQTIKWMLTPRQDIVLLILAMPAVFLIMSMRSESRIWMVMRGIAKDDDERDTDIALFKENFELAAICQYYTIIAFVRLCLSFLDKGRHQEDRMKEEMKTAMTYVGFQGALGWAILGIAHSCILFVLAYSHNLHWNNEKKGHIQKAEHVVGLFASAFSLLCTYNMIVVCKLDFVNTGMRGNANLKFNGTKIMLLLGPNQLKFLLIFANSANVHVSSFREKLGFDESQAYLLHATLMCYECFVVVLLNAYAWRHPIPEADHQGNKAALLG